MILAQTETTYLGSQDPRRPESQKDRSYKKIEAESNRLLNLFSVNSILHVGFLGRTVSRRAGIGAKGQAYAQQRTSYCESGRLEPLPGLPRVDFEVAT